MVCVSQQALGHGTCGQSVWTGGFGQASVYNPASTYRHPSEYVHTAAVKYCDISTGIAFPDIRQLFGNNPTE